MTILEIGLTALSTLLVTVLAGVLLDYIKHSRPRVTYSVKDAVVIDLDEKRVGAYVVWLSNPSKRVVKDLTCHISAPPATLRNGGVSATQGLQYSFTDSDDGIQLSMPYLKRGDELQLTIIAEARVYVPATPMVALRSPHDVSIALNLIGKKPPSFQLGFMTAAIVSALVVAILTGSLRTEIVPFQTTQRDVLTFAASAAGLPHLAEVFATSTGLEYYNQGDLAYALAASATDQDQIKKYRRFLLLVVESAPRMMNQSWANLYYSLGKIDLLLGDNSGATRDFRQALVHSRSTVDAKSKIDRDVRDFLAANGLR